MVDKYDYKVKDEKAFGKIICSANSQEDESTLNTEKPCIFEIVPKGTTIKFQHLLCNDSVPSLGQLSLAEFSGV